jgi:hypothetical protein
VAARTPADVAWKNEASTGETQRDDGTVHARTVRARDGLELLIEAPDPGLVGMQYKMSTLSQMGNPITYFTARRRAPLPW